MRRRPPRGTRMQADRRRRRDVQRLLAAGLRDAHVPAPRAPRARRDTPCPSWPNSPGAGPGQLRLVQPARRGANWWPAAAPRSASSAAGSSAFDQPQAEVRAHAGAQHLGRPQRGRALERDHLAKAEGGGAAQDRADVAGVLQPVQHHASARRGCSAGGAGRSSTKPIGAGDSSAADAGEQRVGDDHRPGRRRRPIRRAPAARRTRQNTAMAGLHAARAARRGTGGRPPARCGPACGRRVPSCASRRRSLSSGLSRERDVLGVRSRSRDAVTDRPSRRPARHERGRHRAEGPAVVDAGAVHAQRLQVLGRAVALVRGEAVVRELLVQLLAQPVAVHLGQDGGGGDRLDLGVAARRSPRPARRASAGGCRPPAPWPASGAGPRRRASSPASWRAGC